MTVICKAALTSTFRRIGRVPAESSARRVLICNRSAGNVAARLAFTLSGSEPALEDYVLYDEPCLANDSIAINEHELNTGPNVDVWAYAASANLSITVMD